MPRSLHRILAMARASYIILLVVVGAVFADACSSSGWVLSIGSIMALTDIPKIKAGNPEMFLKPVNRESYY